ncbi:MAG: type II toxin-antitoxin system VapC family toxin [Lysobacterales bacterium]|nr:MAG: type II toxin-antitoxin system VapC family toxin [Xanthomonadales bacterium]
MKGDAVAIERLAAANRADVRIPQPVVAEIAYGIQRLPASKRRQRLEERFDLICGELARAPWTDSVSERFGYIKATLERRGQRIEDFDAAIAAHALAEDGVLVTANGKDMARIPRLAIEDWARR